MKYSVPNVLRGIFSIRSDPTRSLNLLLINHHHLVGTIRRIQKAIEYLVSYYRRHNTNASKPRASEPIYRIFCICIVCWIAKGCNRRYSEFSQYYGRSDLILNYFFLQMRHKADDRVNLQPIDIIRNGTEKRIKWKNIFPGDIIKVKSGEEFPADMVLISSAQTNGICYVSTANLDGYDILRLVQPNYRRATHFTIDEFN